MAFSGLGVDGFFQRLVISVYPGTQLISIRGFIKPAIQPGYYLPYLIFDGLRLNGKEFQIIAHPFSLLQQGP